MTKKLSLVVAIVGVVLFAIFIYSRQLGICPNHSYSECANFLDDLALVMFPIIPLFIFSLITYKMRKEVYGAWWKFARIWIPLSMFAVLISPSYGNWMFPIEKGTVAFFSSGVFVIISVAIIAFQYLRNKK